MKCIIFQFIEISIQVIPDIDRCFIFKNGFPIWAGNKDELIKLLESIHENNNAFAPDIIQ